MKGNFWSKIFRKGYCFEGYHSKEYNGKMAKTDAKTIRTKLNNFLNRIKNEQE